MGKNRKPQGRINFQCDQKTVSSLAGTPVNRDKQQKRTKSQSSPDSLNTSTDNPDKRPVPLDAYSVMMAQAQDLSMVTQSQMTSPSPSQSILPQIPPYMGANGQFYNPLPSTPAPQYMMPATSPQQYIMPNNSAQQYISPGYQHPPAAPVSTSPQQTGNVNFQQFVIDKLESLDRRLNKLDSIEIQISSLSNKLSKMDDRVSSLEGSFHNSSRRITEIEASRAYDAQTCDELQSKQSNIDKQLKEVSKCKQKLTDQQVLLQTETARLSEEVLDLQSRSMRDNLLFFNFHECSTADERSSEECSKLVLHFCLDTLQIPDAPQIIKLDRAYRIGRYNPTKKRHIEAKFNFHQDKLSVKRKVNELLKHSDFGVGDQFPKAIQDRRRKLIPLMIKAKNEGKRAVLAYDKLYVNNVLMTADNVPEPEPMS